MPLDAEPPELIRNTEHCYVCGPRNGSGLHVPFAREGIHGSRAVYTVLAEHCGWPGLLHGGVAFALMDEALAWSLYFQDLYGVTARVETRFRQPIRVGSTLRVRAFTLDRHRRIVNARAEIRLAVADEPVVAEANATMYLLE
jgi:acyl-coenzyme A thioesterase PaaI-like protein